MKTVAKSVHFAFIGNFLGIPALSLPFPISVQHWNEHKLFRVANVIEQKIAAKRQPPPEQNSFTYRLCQRSNVNSRIATTI